MAQYKCKQCGKEFTSYNKSPKYCGLFCKAEAQSFKADFEVAKNLYEKGMTQEEVAKELGTTQKVIHSLFKRHNYKCRVAVKRNQEGKNNDSWKGEKAGYSAKHYRVRKLKGRPAYCQVCKANDPNLTYEWASLTGDYNNPEDYKRMCKSCHAKYDNIIKNIIKDFISEVRNKDLRFLL